MGASADTRLSTVPAVLSARDRADEGGEFLRLIHAGADDEVVSYGDLIAEARGWSARYAAEGLAPGDRVIVILRHSLDLYAAYVGALLGGQVPAMFSFPSPKFSEAQYFENVGTLIAGANARAVVAYPELATTLAERERAALGDAVLLTPGAEPAGEPPPAPEIDPDAPAFVQYSSGTTGLKKGVVVSHRALLAQVEAYGDAIGAGRDDRIVSWLPLYHDMGLITCLFLPLLRGVPLVAMSPFDWVAAPASWLRAASDHRATLSWLPNFAYAFMAANARDADLEGVDLSSLRGVVNCSEPVTAASHDAFVERFRGHGFDPAALASSYAMAENVFAVTSGGFGVPIPTGQTVVSSGRALPGTEIRIVDGEVAVRSDCLMEGYDGNPVATADALRDGWFFTGDSGHLDGEDLYVTGRIKDLVIVGGRNVYPQDVEEVVHGVDGVVAGRAVAFGVRDERQGTEGLVVMAETEGGDAEAIRAGIHTAVAERTEVVPTDIALVEPRTLRKSSSGKLARGANRDLYLERRQADASAPAAAEAPAGDLRESVRAAVTRVARVPRVDDDQSILRSGLVDSFGMAELFSELEAATGVRLTADRLGAIDRLDTVDALAELLAAETGQAAPAVALEPGDVPMSAGPAQSPRRRGGGLWTAIYRVLLRRHGVRFGPGLRVLGPIHLQIEGSGRNVVLGRNVTLMPGAHIKNRENGRVVLHDGARLDSVARVVAANDATIELGENAALGLGTVINAGRDVLIGRNSFTAAHCVINASDHGLAAGTPMREQPYEHAPILIGEDVWLGAGVLVSKGARIGHGAVVSAGAAVAGDVPSGAIVHGRPARVIKFRE